MISLKYTVCYRLLIFISADRKNPLNAVNCRKSQYNVLVLVNTMRMVLPILRWILLPLFWHSQKGNKVIQDFITSCYKNIFSARQGLVYFEQPKPETMVSTCQAKSITVKHVFNSFCILFLISYIRSMWCYQLSSFPRMLRPANISIQRISEKQVWELYHSYTFTYK